VDIQESMAPAMALALSANFGSVERWHEAFVALGQAQRGGAGRMLLSFDARTGTLVNRWVADSTQAGGIPVLALDLHEPAAIEAIDWGLAYARYQAAVEQSSEPYGAAPDEVAGSLLVDVRRAEVFEQSGALVAGARWRDPKHVGAWAAELPAGRDVVVYCVYGHAVGRATALRLRAAGVDARFLRGGFDGWKAAGRPLQAKGGPS